jgi:metal-dependent amidase/aminoacylase/carboxypeptidase family protein
LKETTGLPYASQVIAKQKDNTNESVMHACGHDAHVTRMLGVAKIVVSMKTQWKGTLVFVGQPAEEILTGADAMVKDRMYERGVPFYNHNPNFQVDLSAISFGTVVGTIALLDLFRK